MGESTSPMGPGRRSRSCSITERCGSTTAWGVVTLPDDGGVLSLQLETETDTLVFIDGVPYGATNPFHPRLDVTAFAGQRSPS